jgi:hypothetical protein
VPQPNHSTFHGGWRESGGAQGPAPPESCPGSSPSPRIYGSEGPPLPKTTAPKGGVAHLSGSLSLNSRPPATVVGPRWEKPRQGAQGGLVPGISSLRILRGSPPAERFFRKLPWVLGGPQCTWSPCPPVSTLFGVAGGAPPFSLWDPCRPNLGQVPLSPSPWR